MFVPDPGLDLSSDLDLSPELTFLNIIITNCSLKWSISSSIIYSFPKKIFKMLYKLYGNLLQQSHYLH